MANSIQIIDDEAYKLLQFVKNFRINNPDANIDALCDSRDEDGDAVYSDAQIDMIMEFWDAPASSYIPASSVSGAGPQIADLADELRKGLADADARGSAAINGLSAKLEEQARAVAQMGASHNEAISALSAGQQEASDAIRKLSEQIGMISGAIAALADGRRTDPAPPSPDPAQDQPADLVEEGQEDAAAPAAGPEPGSGIAAAGEAAGAADPVPDPSAAAGGDGDGAVPPDGGDAPSQIQVPEPSPVSMDPAADQDAGSSQPDEDGGGLSRIVSELQSINSSLSSMRGDIASLRDDFRELSDSVKDMACVTPIPAEKDGRPSEPDGSEGVIDGIVRETAASGILASPLSALQSSLRAYRDSFARRYAASLACMAAQDSEVNAKFNRSAELSLKIVSSNGADFRKGIAALAQDGGASQDAAPSSGAAADPAAGKEQSK